MKFRLPIFILAYAFASFLNPLFGQTNYYSNGNQDVSNVLYWWTGTDGTGSHPSNFTTANQIFNIQNGHTMTSSLQWTISGTGSKLVIKTGGQFTAGAFNHSLTLDMESGATWVHSHTTYSTLTFGTLNSNSNFQLNTASGFAATRTYGNLILNSVTINPGTSNLTITGNLDLRGTGIFRGTNTGTPTHSIGGDILVGSGATWTTSNGSGTPTYNITGTITNNGGTISAPAANGKSVINLNGSNSKSVTLGTSNGNKYDINIASAKTITLLDNFLIESGTFTVNGTLICGTNLISGAGGFTLSSGATLKTANTAGVSTSEASGSVQTTSRSFSTGASYQYNGASAQATGSGLPSTINNLTINNSAGVTLTNSVGVDGALTITSGDLTTGGNTITLGSAGTLSETSTNIVLGNMQTTRTVTKGVNETFGGMGFEFMTHSTDAVNPGSTVLTRVTGTALSGTAPYTSNQSIKRYYNIVPTNRTGLHAQIVFHYCDRSSELNSLTEANLKIWKWDGSIWANGDVRTSIDPTANTVSWGINYGLNWDYAWGGTTNQFTLGDPASPLPAELMTFVTVPQGRNVQLEWNTATEVNTSLFAIERSTDNLSWLRVGSVAASGYSNAPKDYTFTDKMLNTGKYCYRLKIIDNDGAFEYSPVIEAEVSVPVEFAVSQNYPNPFNPSTKINYDIPEDSRIVLSLYGITGEKVAELVNGDVPAGYYTHQLDMAGYNLSSGIYFYKLVGSSLNGERKYNVVRKMMYLR